MGLTLYSYDKYISEDFSKLKNPNIKSIRRKNKTDDYLPNLILNQIFNENIQPDKYPLVFSLIRKTRIILKEYNSFASKLRKYDVSSKKINFYFDLLFKAEITILYCGQVIDLLRTIINKNIFDKNDGSHYARLYELHNQIKHVSNELVKKKQLQVIKLDDNGIYTTEIRLDFKELREFIFSLTIVVESIMTNNK